MSTGTGHSEHTAANVVCGCGATVIVRDDGRILAAQPSPWGMQLPDGGTLTARQLGRSILGRDQPSGHATHRCRAGVTGGEQGALFEIAPPAGVRRGGLR